VRVDASRVEAAPFVKFADGIQVTSRCGPVNVWVVSSRAGLREKLEARRKRLVGFEESFGFNPASQAADLEQLRQLQPSTK
jgi:hypothetical protein